MDNKEDYSRKCKLPEADVDELIPRLYLGNYKSSQDGFFLKNNNIKYIICVMPKFDHDKLYKDITYIHIPIKDNETCLKNLNKLYDYTSDTIAKILLQKKDDGILVHCKRGHHRSAAIIAAFFIKYLKLNYNTIVSYISCTRPCALRRDSCMVVALKEYEYMLNRSCNFNNMYRYKCCNLFDINKPPRIYRMDLNF